MNIQIGLLFLDGHIADPGLAVSLTAPGDAGSGDDTSPDPGRGTHHVTFPHALRRQTMNLFQTLMFLGGRPMTAGHNYDAGEPFPQTFGNRVASERRFKLAYARERTQALPSQPKPCGQH